MTIENICALEKIKKLEDNSQDIIFADPPYALGSTVFIDTDGKPKYKEAKDFMSKWEMPDHTFWETFFVEANRVLKFGGRILFFGIDRQLMLFQYYGIAANLEIKQSLYWYFMSSFPKATDLSKNIDKRLGVERQVVGYDDEKAKKMANSAFGSGVYKENGFNDNNMDVDGACILTESATDLGKKYQGYKYSLSPMKQVLETIMVFQKGTKNKSTLDDVFAYEAGDTTISPSMWAIDKCRVPYSNNDDSRIGKDYSHNAKSGLENGSKKDNASGEPQQLHNTDGRFPSQMFVDEDIAEALDQQSGELTSGARKSSYTRRGKNPNETYGKFNEVQMDDMGKDSGGASRVLHTIAYMDTELDIAIYSSKVSTKERNAGLDELEDVDVGANNHANPIGMKNTQINTSSGKQRNVTTVTKNNHPTLKPIKMILKVAELLKSPNPQNVFFPFSGAGSEIIGFMKAGFDKELFECSELSEEYVDIAHKRIDYWEDVDINEFIVNKKIKKPKAKAEVNTEADSILF